MDMNEIRRSLLLSIFNGEAPMIGQLSKYEKKTLTFPNAANSNAWDAGAVVPCSFQPKIVIFRGGNYETAGNIYKGIFAFSPAESGNTDAGATWYKNLANGSQSVAGYKMTTSAGASCFKFDNGTFYATRISGNGYWSNTDTYTFEFYG